MMNIENIENSKFIKTLNIKELNILAADIRTFLLKSISKTGGHLSSCRIDNSLALLF